MLIPRIVRGGPDKAFAIVKNDEATLTLVDGDVVKWTIAAAKNYGSDVLQNTATANEDLVSGVMSGRDVLAGSFGLCQVYGYHSNVKSGTSTAGVPQKTVATAGTAGDGAAADGPGEYLGICLKATASGRAGIFIQKM
jgi:hypothetical protein